MVIQKAWGLQEIGPWYMETLKSKYKGEHKYEEVKIDPKGDHFMSKQRFYSYWIGGKPR
jgi:hypothetical protein